MAQLGVMQGHAERVLVTGGAGFIGPHVVARLLTAGARVAVVDNFSTGHPDNLADAVRFGLDEDAVWTCDVRSDRVLEIVESWRPTVIVHLAAKASVLESIRSPLQDADINIMGTAKTLEIAATAGVRRVVLATSSAIFGRVSAQQLPVDERAPLMPCSPYGLSKAAALAYLNWYGGHHGFDTVALVLGNVYGPGQGHEAGVVGRFMAALTAGQRPTIYGDGTQTRDFVYVDDVADAFCRASFGTCNGLINIGTGVETSIHEVLDLVANAIGSGQEPIYADPVPGEPYRLVLSPDRACTLLGWTATTPLVTGVKMMAASWINPA